MRDGKYHLTANKGKFIRLLDKPVAISALKGSPQFLYFGTADSLRHQRRILLLKNKGFLHDAVGNERQTVREPGVNPAFERAHSDDSFGSQQQRHTGAGRFVGSRTVENDVAVPGDLAVALFDLFHSNTQRTRDHLRKSLDIHGLAQVDD